MNKRVDNTSFESRALVHAIRTEIKKQDDDFKKSPSNSPVRMRQPTPIPGPNVITAGGKKFLYMGPASQQASEEDEEDWEEFLPKKKVPENADEKVLNEAWNIKKNVTAKNRQMTVTGFDNGSELNVSKEYFSRYGNLKDSSISLPSKASTSTPKSPLPINNNSESQAPPKKNKNTMVHVIGSVCSMHDLFT